MGVAISNDGRGRAVGRNALIAGGAAALLSGGVYLGYTWNTVPPAPVARDLAKPTPPSPWTTAELGDLLDAVNGSAAEGLRPVDYDQHDLDDVVPSRRSGPAVDLVATHAALSLAHDYAEGRIRHRNRFNWYIDNNGPDAAALTDQLRSARAENRLEPWLRGLLPVAPSYAALRAALATVSTQDRARRQKIAVNMERWRWLPRDFGTGDQIYVNLPSYQLQLRTTRLGQGPMLYDVVIGAPDMPTPALSAMATQVIANPTWIVPQSIVTRSKLRPGSSGRYTFTTLPSGRLRVSQKPGAGNPLGKIKIEFPNALAIYLHDTPSRWLFGRPARAFSHGCVRVQHVDDLAAHLLDHDPRFAAALQEDRTRGFRVSHLWRVNIVYLTMTAEPEQALVELDDPYKLDGAMAAALEGRTVRWPAIAAAEPAATKRPPHVRPAPAIESPSPVAQPTVAAIDPTAVG